MPGGCDGWGRGWRGVNNHAVLIISICFALINVSCYDSVMQSNCVVTLCSHVQSRLDLTVLLMYQSLTKLNNSKNRINTFNYLDIEKEIIED